MEKAKDEAQSGRFSIIPARAFDDNRITHAARTVLGLLGTYGDRDGWCWPSQTTLAKRLGVSRQSIQDRIDELVKLGYLLKRPRQRSNGSNTSCMYRILFDQDLETPDDKLQEEKPKEKPAPEPKLVSPFNMYAVAQAIAETCSMFFEANKGQLLKEAKIFTKLPGFSVERMKEVYEEPTGNWFLLDFRGKKGQSPTPKQIRETWLQYVNEPDEIANSVTYV